MRHNLSIVGRVLLAQRVGEPNPSTCRPSGAKCVTICGAVSIVGRFSSPSGLGDPTPTGSTVCDNTTLRSSGARRLDVSRCYRHIAPLERKAAQFAARYPSWGEFSSPSAPLERKAAQLAGNPFNGWGTQPLRIQLRVLTFQFSCLPVHLSPLWG